MKKMKTGYLMITLMLVITIACSFTRSFFGNAEKISNISFCSDVTDEGECLDKGNSFPAGTSSVYAYFTYEGMKDGQKWSRIWTQDGGLYDETLDEAWDNGVQGWVAYSVDDPDGLAGDFTLEILVGENQVQKASFTVEKTKDVQSGKAGNDPASFPAFGPITMAEDAADNAFPIGAAKEFDYGISKVVAVFAYSNMTQEMTYTAEWLHDGQTLIRKEYPWEDTANGMHFTSLTDDAPLSAGKYTINLYLQGEPVRTTGFQIIDKQSPKPVESGVGTAVNTNPRPNHPATPEEVVDADALKYFYMISDANLPVLNQVVKDNLAGWTRVKVVDSNPCGADALACFAKGSCDERWGGTVYLPRAEMANVTDVQITATLTHELTHGMEFYGSMRCGCSVQKEFYAMAAEMDYVYYSGNLDTFNADYGGVWDANGKVNTGKLWDIVKDAYYDPEKCPEY